MVLALGTLMDLDLPAHSSEAMQFYQIARSAMSLDSVLEKPSIVAIQALVRASFLTYQRSIVLTPP